MLLHLLEWLYLNTFGTKTGKLKMFEVLGDIPASVFKEEPGDVFAVPTIVSGNTVAKAQLRERTICFLLSDILP